MELLMMLRQDIKIISNKSKATVISKQTNKS